MEQFVIGLAGAACLELFKLYEMRSRISMTTWNERIRSPLFWLPLLGMLAASGFITWAMHPVLDPTQPFRLVLAGMGARSLIRSPLEAHAGATGTHAKEQPGEQTVRGFDFGSEAGGPSVWDAFR